MDITRRILLRAAAAAPNVSTPFVSTFALAADRDKLAALERQLDGRLGVTVLDTATGKTAGQRQDERFPMCSTFKAVLAAQALGRAAGDPDFLARRLRWTQADLVAYSPVTERHVDSGLTVAQLCEATVQISDNTAANVLMKELGGPAGLTAYARSLGDTTLRLDRWETEMGTAQPGDPGDTTTPLAMARTLAKLVTGDGLPPAQREQLRAWMLGTKTGAARIRAGVPPGWRVANKTGTGGYGAANDAAVLFPPNRAPLVVVVYTHRNGKDAEPRDEIVAAATRAALALV